MLRKNYDLFLRVLLIVCVIMALLTSITVVSYAAPLDETQTEQSVEEDATDGADSEVTKDESAQTSGEAEADEEKSDAQILYEKYEEDFPDDPLNYRESGLADEELADKADTSTIRRLMRTMSLMAKSVSSSSSGYTKKSGVDISTHQGDLDWDTMVSNADFAIIRAGYRGYTEGTVNTDSRWVKNIKAANERNFPVGAYFFSQAITVEEAEEEANYILSLVKGYDVPLGIYIDYEYVTSSTSTVRMTRAGLTNAQRTAIVHTFMDIIQDAGYTSGIYANKAMLTDDMNTSEFDSDHTIWLAHWTYDTKETTYSRSFNFHQYSDKGDASTYGVPTTYTTTIDLDYYYCYNPSYKVSVSVPSGYSDTTLWIDGEAYTGTLSNGTLSVTLSDSSAQTATMYCYNSSGVPTGMHCWRLTWNLNEYNVEDVTGLNDLISYHGFSIRTTDDAGIRFKSGVSTSTKSSLLGSGIDGFTLSEYGTISMTKANNAKYPLVVGGTKVMQGKAYYKSGSKTYDYVYETVSGRARFTSVLTGLTSSVYNTDFTFRGYMNLTRNGTTVTFYGPPVSKSIYTVAKQIQSAGEFTTGSDAYKFVQNIIDTVGK